MDLSEEVEKSIEEGKRLIDFWNNYNYATEEGKEKCLYSAKSIETLLSYIETLEKQQKENELKDKQLQKISDEFLQYDWKNSNNEQIYNQLKSLYESIFRGKNNG